MKKLQCKNMILTGGRAKVCIPIMGKERDEILMQAEWAYDKKPDIVEWRADDFIMKKERNREEMAEMIDALNCKLKNIPWIFTYRSKKEGGEGCDDWEKYADYCRIVAKNGNTSNLEFIDIEAYGNQEQAKTLIADIHKEGMRVIGSNHYFDRTPEKQEIIHILRTMENLGADVCKIAVMPQTKEDVSMLISASKEADKLLKVPIITMAMGELGAVTRVSPGETKSVLTFAAGLKASAPGQPPLQIVRHLLKINEGCLLHGNISLIGFMGTGKTTISKALSLITGFQEIDVDKYIVEQAGMEISQIFEKYGEAYFRNLETESIRKITEKEGYIISCGGGAVLKDENVKILKNSGKIVLLTASPETIFDRVKDHTHRPILNQDMSLKHVKELMAEREPRYQAVADFQVNVDKNDRVLTCYEILNRLEQEGCITIPVASHSPEKNS